MRPGIETLEVSAKTGEGMDVWLKMLEDLQDRERGQPESQSQTRPGSIADQIVVSRDRDDRT